jgi:hypothetical protein
MPFFAAQKEDILLEQLLYLVGNDMLEAAFDTTSAYVLYPACLELAVYSRQPMELTITSW